jgi:hypothetical protein
VFSITFAASATFIDGALCIQAFIIFQYISDKNSVVSLSTQATTFTIFSTV